MGKNVVYPDYNSQDSLIDEYISILFSEIEANFGTDLHRLTLVDNWPVDDSFTMLNKTDEFPYLSEVIYIIFVVFYLKHKYVIRN